MEECPRAAELLEEYGIHCVGCFFSENDTLETGGAMHNMSDEEVDEMIEEINGELEKEWRAARVIPSERSESRNLIPQNSKTSQRNKIPPRASLGRDDK